MNYRTLELSVFNLLPSAVKVNRKFQEFSNSIIMHKSEVLELSEMYKRIEGLCKKRGVNITQMCKESGVARAPLTELKMGRTAILSARNADKIASYFGVSVGYLLGNEQKEKPADQKADGLRGLGYDELTPENKAVIDALIDTLLKSQSGGR
jgi:transcriptional regulator with XRE-family HTH domain